MISIILDYRNLQFGIYQHGKPVENPLPVEVQRSVLTKVIHDVVNEIRTQVNSQLTASPPGLKQHLFH